MPLQHAPAVHLAVDAVVFAYREGQLHVLTIEQTRGALAGQRALPGGFVREGEGLRAAVERELREEAGLTVNYLEQLRTYGDDVRRDPRAQVVTVAYWALVRPAAVASSPEGDARAAEWVLPQGAPPLAFDHERILADALSRLRAKLKYQPVGFELLPEVFGFSELEQLYGAILGRPVDRRNFRKKVLGFGLLTATGATRKEGPGRPATLYRFDAEKYRALERDGFLFEV